MGRCEASCVGLNINDFVIVCQCVSLARHTCISGAEVWKPDLISVTPGLLTRCTPDIVCPQWRGSQWG